MEYRDLVLADILDSALGGCGRCCGTAAFDVLCVGLCSGVSAGAGGEWTCGLGMTGGAAVWSLLRAELNACSRAPPGREMRAFRRPARYDATQLC